MFPLLRTTISPVDKLFEAEGVEKSFTLSPHQNFIFHWTGRTDGKLSILLSPKTFYFNLHSFLSRGGFCEKRRKISEFSSFSGRFSSFPLLRPSSSSVAVHTLYNFESISCRINRRVSSISFSFFHPMPLPHTRMHTVTNCASSFPCLSLSLHSNRLYYVWVKRQK